MSKITLAFLILVLLASASFAIQHDYTPFLCWGVGARPMGMGKAFSFLADDANAIYYNPAGLGFQSGIQIEGQLGQEFYRVANNFYGLTKSNFGIGYQTYGKYVIPYWKIDNTYDEFETNGCSLLMLAYAHQINHKLSVGGSLKSFIIDAKKGYVGGKNLDIGLLFRPSAYWQFGLAAQNLFSIIDDFRAYKSDPNVGPLTSADVLLYPNIKVGLVNQNQYFVFSAELLNLGYNEQLHWGIEKPLSFLFESQIAFRLGMYGTLPTYVNSFQKTNKSIGFSFCKNWFDFDYAVEFYPDGGTSARSSFIIGMDDAFLSRFSQVGVPPFWGYPSGPKEEEIPVHPGTPLPNLPTPSSPGPPSPSVSSGGNQQQPPRQESGGLIVLPQYNPLPLSGRDGATSGQVTLVKLPEKAQFSPVLGPRDLVVSEGRPVGKQSDLRRLMPKKEKTNTYQPLLSKRYSNILISRTTSPMPFGKMLSLMSIAPYNPNVIRNLVVGRYMMEFEASNSTPWYGEFEILPNHFTTVTPTVEPSYGNLTGTVHRPDGSPCRSLGVVTASGQGVTRSCNLDANGNFQFAHLSSGTYYLQVGGNQRGDGFEDHYLAKTALATVPTGYQTDQADAITLEAYISTGNIKGRIQPLSALTGYQFGRLNRQNIDIKTLRDGMTYMPEAVINFQTGHYAFSNKGKGPYQLDVRQVGGWNPPGLRDVVVLDLGRTVEVQTINLEADPEYLPDLQITSARLQQRRSDGEWLDFPYTSNVPMENNYRIVATIRNGGWAAAPNFTAKVIQRKTTATTTSYTVLAETQLISLEGLGAEATYYVSFESLNWMSGAVNEIIFKLDPYNTLAELGENNNEAVVYKYGSIPTRDLRFYSPPELYEVEPSQPNVNSAAPLYIRHGNEQILLPGDEIRLKTLVSGVYAGDQLVVYLNSKNVPSREVYRTSNLSQDYLANYVSFPIILDQPGEFWFTFVLNPSSSALDTNSSNNLYETEKFYVLSSLSDALIYNTNVPTTLLQNTGSPSSIRIKFCNKSNSESQAGFVNYRLELLTADDLVIPITYEAFPAIGAGQRNNPTYVTKTFNLPGGVFGRGYNRLAMTFLDPNSGEVIKRSYCFQSCRLPAIYTTPQRGVQPVLLGVPVNLDNFTVKPVIRSGNRCHYNIMKNAIGLGAEARDWVGENCRIDGYIMKTIRVDNGNGILYNSQYPATEARKKHYVYPVMVINYAGALDSAALAESSPFLNSLIPIPTGSSANTEENYDFGAEQYEAKIDYDFVDGVLPVADPGPGVSNAGSIFYASRNTFSQAIGKKGFEIALDLIPLPIGDTIGLPIKEAFIARGVEAEIADDVAGDIVGQLIQADAEAILSAGEEERRQITDNTLLNLNVRQPVLGDVLIYPNNKRIEEGNNYTLCISTSVTAGCIGMAWSVADFDGFYTKEDHEFFYNRFKRGVWVKAARLQF
jgi:hypothetical protein